MRLIFLVLISFFSSMQAQQNLTTNWEIASQFEGGVHRLGYAGMAATKAQNGFLICGGANFPEGLPWDGGKKTFTDAIFFWDGSSHAPKVLSIKLPQASGYFGYIGKDNDLYIAGGETSTGPTKKAYKISQSEISTLPDLPIAVTSPMLTIHQGVLYLMGGDEATKTSNHTFALDLQYLDKGWKALADLPFATANAAVFSIGNHIYLAGGRSRNSSGISSLLTEVYQFDIRKNIWTKETQISIDGKVSPFTAAAYSNYKNRYLIFAGGDDGQVFHQIETLIKKKNEAKSEVEAQNFNKEKNYLVQHHQGFNSKVLVYDTQKKHWLTSQLMPFVAQVTTASVLDGDNMYIFSGEIRPGVRSPRILKAKIDLK